MTERVYTTRDEKNTWGDGPWLTEPDKISWTDEATGLPCLIVRGPAGALCGYVGVSEGHPLFEQDYWGAYEVLAETPHGGLTYADHCAEGPEESAICHIPEPGQPDHVWWFGFDCAHAFDYIPGQAAANRKRYEETGDKLWLDIMDENETYRTVEYVQGEVRGLARALAAVES
jgi:hypothetical protein